MLGYRGVPGLSTQIKSSYARVILPYEHFLERGRNSPAIAATLARDSGLKHSSTPTPSGKFSRFTASASAPPSPLTGSSSPLSEPPEEDIKDSSRRRSARASHDQSREWFAFKMSLLTRSSENIKNVPIPVVPPPIFYDKTDTIKTEVSIRIFFDARLMLVATL